MQEQESGTLSQDTSPIKVEEYAIVSLMGHKTYPGKVEEIDYAGGKMLQIHVLGENGEFMFVVKTTSSSIHSMVIVSREYAIAAAKKIEATPMEYDHQQIVKEMAHEAFSKMTAPKILEFAIHGIESGMIALTKEQIEAIPVSETPKVLGSIMESPYQKTFGIDVEEDYEQDEY